MQKLLQAVDKYRKLILDSERYIWKNPETGYKEIKTSKYMQETFENLGYELTLAGDIPGFYTVVDTGRPGPTVLIMGELDSIICPQHPECDPETGAVHSCGHNAQCAALVGIAAALKEPGVLDDLSGRVKLCAVPAEELLEIEYRSELKKKGIIKYFGGKGEFLSRGYFDDVDLGFMVHTGAGFAVRNGMVGCMAKKITYKGKASHAGGSPWNGINALYAASNGLNAINAVRETFQEKDIIRVHPIMTEGGAMVNAIPGSATLESYVRGKTFEGIIDANRKVNRALVGAALSLGANVDITDFPGYAPVVNDRNLMEVTKEAMALALPEREFTYYDVTSSGSSDIGDLCSVMPIVHPNAAGMTGTSHGSDYYITDPEAACVDSAKMQLGMLYLLLKDGGVRAKKIADEYVPMFNGKEGYMEYMDALMDSGDRIEYTDDGNAKVRL